MSIGIELTQGCFAIVNDEDADLMNFKWQVQIKKNGACNATRRIWGGGGNGKTIHMHRVILERILGRELSKGEYVDHINCDSLDNRRSNLRIATNAENTRNVPRRRNNTSGYKGVSWHKSAQKWVARITVDRKVIALGSFKDPKEAHEAYKKAAIKHHGKYANFGDTP